MFTAPCREATRLAANGAEYSKVNAINKAKTGKGLMRQAASISNGINQVENLLLSDDGDPSTLLEGHPELCFRAFNGEALSFSKTCAAGVDERLEALVNVPEYERGDWRPLARTLREDSRTVDFDDLLDAFAFALTAKAPEGESQTLPEDLPTDHEGLPMQMVYRAAEPLSAE